MLAPMGWLMDLIREIPLSSVLRERLVDADREIAHLRAELSVLQAKHEKLQEEHEKLQADHAALQAEHADLKIRASQLEQENQRLQQEASERFRAKGPRRFGSPRDRNPYKNFP